MASNRWTGWIAFAGWLMVIIGTIDFFQGLIAVIRDQYYVFTPNQIVVFDMTTWGWITLIWGIVLGLAGLGYSPEPAGHAGSRSSLAASTSSLSSVSSGTRSTRCGHSRALR